jgi:hypothetical protein
MCVMLYYYMMALLRVTGDMLAQHRGHMPDHRRVEPTPLPDAKKVRRALPARRTDQNKHLRGDAARYFFLPFGSPLRTEKTIFAFFFSLPS